MKTLYLVRHAKSSWKEPNLPDHERPLNKRGKRDAPFMAKFLEKSRVLPDLIITSTAKRTTTTAAVFAETLNYAPDKIYAEPELYLASASEMLQVVKRTNDNVFSLMLFGHNPGITDLSNYLCLKEIDNIPTCGIVKMELKRSSWKDFDENLCELRWFEYPKKYLS
ncbi:MAG: histidine phosphatase family protein [Ignavibacteriaceae bacterium]